MNDKKMAIISILLIISITLSFLFANSSFNFENTLTGKAINQIETENLIEDETPVEKFEIPDYCSAFSRNHVYIQFCLEPGTIRPPQHPLAHNRRPWPPPWRVW